MLWHFSFKLRFLPTYLDFVHAMGIWKVIIDLLKLGTYLINVPLKETLTLTQTKTGRNDMYLNLNSYKSWVKT